MVVSGPMSMGRGPPLQGDGPMSVQMEGAVGPVSVTMSEATRKRERGPNSGPNSASFLTSLGFDVQGQGAGDLVSLQENPAFYSFLTDFLGGPDDDVNTIENALSTLTDLQQQLNFNQGIPPLPPPHLSLGHHQPLPVVLEKPPWEDGSTRPSGPQAVRSGAEQSLSLPDDQAPSPGGVSAFQAWEMASTVMRSVIGAAPAQTYGTVRENGAISMPKPREFAHAPGSPSSSASAFSASISSGFHVLRSSSANTSSHSVPPPELTCNEVRALAHPPLLLPGKPQLLSRPGGPGPEAMSAWGGGLYGASQMGVAIPQGLLPQPGSTATTAGLPWQQLKHESMLQGPGGPPLQRFAAPVTTGIPVATTIAGPTAPPQQRNAAMLPPPMALHAAAGLPSQLPSPALPQGLSNLAQHTRMHDITPSAAPTVPSTPPVPPLQGAGNNNGASAAIASGPSAKRISATTMPTGDSWDAALAAAAAAAHSVAVAHGGPRKSGRKPVGFKVTAKGIKLTRNEKQKQSMGALERQILDKATALQSLASENRSLHTRLQILELAVGRQLMALNLMAKEQKATSAASGAAGAGTGTAGAGAGTGAGRSAGASAAAAALGPGSSAMTAAVAAAAAGGAAASGHNSVLPPSQPLGGGVGGGGPHSRTLLYVPGLGPGMGPSSLTSLSGMGTAPNSGQAIASGAAAGVEGGGGPSSASTLAALAAAAGSGGDAAGLPALLVGAAGGGLLEQVDLDWARDVTIEGFMSWWKQHLQDVSIALLQCGDSPQPGPGDELLNMLISRGLSRTALVGLCSPTVILRLRTINMESRDASPAPQEHWQGVINHLNIGPTQLEELSLLFNTYNQLHGSLASELADAQQELEELIGQRDQQADAPASEKMSCSTQLYSVAVSQHKVLKRVHAIMQKTHVLYSATIAIVAHQVLLPRGFAKCCIQSYPFFPCGPSLMRACEGLKGLPCSTSP